MKKNIYVMLASWIVLASGCFYACGDETIMNFEYQAEVVGHDFTLCPCCGGIIIELADSDEVIRTYEYTDEFQALIDVGEFPVSINLDYELIDTCVNYQFIRILDFEIQ